MRAAVVKKYGPPENFEVREWPDPAAKPGGCVVRVRAVGINFADLLQCMGIYPGTPRLHCCKLVLPALRYCPLISN
jgi:NADPH2:quinone reductase